LSQGLLVKSGEELIPWGPSVRGEAQGQGCGLLSVAGRVTPTSGSVTMVTSMATGLIGRQRERHTHTDRQREIDRQTDRNGHTPRNTEKPLEAGESKEMGSPVEPVE
jgi:hypothetical protein